MMAITSHARKSFLLKGEVEPRGTGTEMDNRLSHVPLIFCSREVVINDLVHF